MNPQTPRVLRPLKRLSRREERAALRARLDLSPTGGLNKSGPRAAPGRLGPLLLSESFAQ